MSGTYTEELLAGCAGFRVEAAETRIGVVEQVLSAPTRRDGLRVIATCHARNSEACR